MFDFLLNVKKAIKKDAHRAACFGLCKVKIERSLDKIPGVMGNLREGGLPISLRRPFTVSVRVIESKLAME